MKKALNFLFCILLFSSCKQTDPNKLVDEGEFQNNYQQKKPSIKH